MSDMLVPAGAGPPPHRHASEEAFRVLEGAIEVSLRDERLRRATERAPAHGMELLPPAA